MIPAAVIDELRARIDPVEVIGRRLELRKSGTSFSASCPFHADKTPSFHVYPDSRRFKCFGCGARGDVFAFLQRFEGKDFKTVVRELAADAGVAVDAGNPMVRRIRARRGSSVPARRRSRTGQGGSGGRKGSPPAGTSPAAEWTSRPRNGSGSATR